MRIRTKKHLAAITVVAAALAACGPTDDSKDKAVSQSTAAQQQTPAAESKVPSSSNTPPSSTINNDSAALCNEFGNIDVDWILPGAQNQWACKPNNPTGALAEAVWSDGATRLAISVVSNAKATAGIASFDELAKMHPGNCQIAVLGHNRECVDLLGSDGVFWVNMGDNYVMVMQSRDSREDLSPLPADAAKANKVRQFAANKVLPTLFEQ